MGWRFVRETRSQGSLQATKNNCYNPHLLLHGARAPFCPWRTKLNTSINTSSFHSGSYCSSSSPLQAQNRRSSCPGSRLHYAVAGPLLTKGQTNHTPHHFKRASRYLTSPSLHLNCKGGMWKELFRLVPMRHCDLFCTEQISDSSVSSDPAESKASHAGRTVRSKTFPS